MKYLLYGNKHCGAGFGNQIRAFISAYIWAKVLNREFITDNYWFTTYFNLPIKTKYDKSLIKKECIYRNKKILNNINFNQFNEDILEFGDGNESSAHLYNNPHHRSEFEKLLKNKTYEDLLKETLIFLLSDVNDNFKKEVESTIYSKLTKPYNSIQFRSFFDAGFMNEKYLSEFLNVFAVKFNVNVPVFVTTDNERITNKIMEVVSNKGFEVFNSGLKNSHTTRSNSVAPIIDWYIMGQGDYLFSTGTTFAISSAILFNTPHFIFNKNKNIIGEANEAKKTFW